MQSMVLIWDVDSTGDSDTQQLCTISAFWQDALNMTTVGLSYSAQVKIFSTMESSEKSEWAMSFPYTYAACVSISVLFTA